MAEQTFKADLALSHDFGTSALFEEIFEGTPAGDLTCDQEAGAWPFQATLPYLGGRLKRTLDVLLTLLTAPLAVALVGISALAIKLTSRGPVFFIQERLGQYGVPFPCFKLRTMVDGAEKGTPQWAAEKDPRITWVGKILRKTRLDELPQLYNVWRGEMSFVGPRPIRCHFAAMLTKEVPSYRLRFVAKPGLTGWDQVHNGYPSTLEAQIRKFHCDLYYLHHASFGLDLLLLGKTLKVILGFKGR